MVKEGLMAVGRADHKGTDQLFFYQDIFSALYLFSDLHNRNVVSKWGSCMLWQ